MVQFVLFFRIFCFVFQDCFKGGVSIFLWSMKFIEMYEIQNTLKKKRRRVRYEHLPVTNDEDTR